MTNSEKAALFVEEGFIHDLTTLAKAAVINTWERAESQEEREECWAEMRAIDTVIRAMVGMVNG